MTSVTVERRAVGDLLREWRTRRRLSQLDLALQAEISARHLSFVETGRSAPSRDMVLRLADQLDVPLRDRNSLLLAAGFAPAYPQATLDSAEMAPVREAVRHVLGGHEPFPAIAVDRMWNLLDSNAAASLLSDGIAPELMRPPANMLRASLHPDGLAPRIVNLAEWRASLLTSLRRLIAVSPDPELSALLDELLSYPGGEPGSEPPAGSRVAIPVRIRLGDAELSLLATHTTFGTPLDITVAELSIEAFFPADAATAAFLRGPAVPGDTGEVPAELTLCHGTAQRADQLPPERVPQRSQHPARHHLAGAGQRDGGALPQRDRPADRPRGGHLPHAAGPDRRRPFGDRARHLHRVLVDLHRARPG
jgi:transcriptional regulator with XRE-family HTH domain